MIHSYIVALGSNMRVPGIGGPVRVIDAARDALGEGLVARSRCIASRPLGPSRRLYANAAALVETPADPPAFLAQLHAIERAFGRRRRGARWRARPLDLDIVLWSGGLWQSPDLVIPHRAFRERGFVLRPAAEVASGWRDPVTGLTLRQLSSRVA